MEDGELPLSAKKAFSQYPRGFVLHSRNTLLMSGLVEMIKAALSGSLVGVPDGI